MRGQPALAAAGSPPALAALGEVVHDRAAPVATRVDALSSLVVVERPSPEAMRIPLDLLDESDATLRGAAGLMSGSLSRAGRGEHRDEADAIDRALIARFREASDPAERTHLLAALGNSVGPEALPVIEGALADPRADVRAAAARALRLGDGVDHQLAEAMTGDGDARVRDAAVFAAGFRPVEPLVAALVKTVTSDPVEYVRAGALSIHLRHLDGPHQIRETVAQVAEHDPKPGVRRVAREALAAQPRSPR